MHYVDKLTGSGSVQSGKPKKEKKEKRKAGEGKKVRVDERARREGYLVPVGGSRPLCSRGGDWRNATLMHRTPRH
jgi:hypothetical protein